MNQALSDYISARTIEADLKEADRHFAEHGISDMAGVVALKAALVALANFSEFENSQRPRYRSNPQLSESIASSKKALVFSKYLRKKYVGHVRLDLVQKAIEWKFELPFLADKMGQPEVMFLCNIFLLETAINTYVDENGNGKFFESETDLNYPPDRSRFFSYLETTIRAALAYLNMIIEMLSKEFEQPEDSQKMFELAMKAGKTDFEYLAK